MTPTSPSILLVQPRIALNIKLLPLPFGLLSVASSLRRAGFRVQVIDLNARPVAQLFEEIERERPLFLGFSLMTGPLILDVLHLSAKIKHRWPELPIVWGGPHPTIMPELTIADPRVDIVCRGDGEVTAVNLAQALASGSSLENVDGLVFKEEGQARFTKPAPPVPRSNADGSYDLHLIDLTPYLFQAYGKRCATMITSRGCPYRCRFCWNLMFHGRHYSPWSAEKVMAEIDPLIKAGCEKVLFFESFLGSRIRMSKLGAALRERGVLWGIEDGCRVDVQTGEDFFRELEGNGCSHLTYGAESGSQRILDLVAKDITTEQILQTAIDRRKTKLGARYQWMVGVPTETVADALQTVRLIDRINSANPRSGHSMDMYAPYPGNDLYQMTCEAGWTPPDALEGWGQYRWQGSYPHHQGQTWFFKSVFYSNLFSHFDELRKVSAYTEQTRGLFRLAQKSLYLPAALRWKTRSFGQPWEYQFAERCRYIVERLGSSRRDHEQDEPFSPGK